MKPGIRQGLGISPAGLSASLSTLVKAREQDTTPPGEKKAGPASVRLADAAEHPDYPLFPTLIIAWLLCSATLLWKLDAFTRGGAWP